MTIDMADNTMPNIDIRDFPAVSAADLSDFVVLSSDNFVANVVNIYLIKSISDFVQTVNS